MISGQVYPAKTPAAEFVSDSNTFAGAALARVLFDLPVNAEMYRRKVWFSFCYVGAADANFMIDGEVVFSYRGERIFALPVQYNARSANTNGAPVDIYWNTNSVIFNPSNNLTLMDEPIIGTITDSSAVNLGAVPFRGTFVCDRIQFIQNRYRITGAEKMYAFLACQSEYPY